MVCATVPAALAQESQVVGAPAQQAAHATFVGNDACGACHSPVSKRFLKNPHTKMLLRPGDNGIVCENCHGPGSAHVQNEGDMSMIFDPAKAPAAEANAMCLRCHAGVHPNLLSPPHAKAGQSCMSCHSIHSAAVQKDLLKAPQPTP